MTKSSLDPSSAYDQPESFGAAPETRAPRDGSTCDLYAPGHQMHYRHQGHAVHSPASNVANTILDATGLTLVLDDGSEMRWLHHDLGRLGRILELVPSKRVAYPAFHALRVGPYWFNCAAETDDWQDCRIAGAPRPT